jgi:DNA-binding CsgD family transcriptional regulator
VIEASPLTNRALRMANAGELPALLTLQEIEIMTMAAEGVSYDDIATRFGVTRSAIANHLKRVRDKLHCTSTVQAAVKLAKAGLI